MYKIGDYVIYLKDVCKVFDIKEKYMNDTDYYILVPLNDNSLKLNVPVNCKSLRNLITKEEVNSLIDNMVNIEVLPNNDKTLEAEYKRLLQNGSHEDLVKIIKTTYLRNKERIDNKRKISNKDKTYFEIAEKYLYTEISVVLDLTFDETKNYIINKLAGVLENE